MIGMRQPNVKGTCGCVWKETRTWPSGWFSNEPKVCKGVVESEFLSLCKLVYPATNRINKRKLMSTKIAEVRPTRKLGSNQFTLARVEVLLALYTKEYGDSTTKTAGSNWVVLRKTFWACCTSAYNIKPKGIEAIVATRRWYWYNGFKRFSKRNTRKESEATMETDLYGFLK